MTLKEIRLKRGLTLRHLAALSGVGASTIGNFENGKTVISEISLKRIADVLEVSLDAIKEPISSVYGVVARGQSEGGWRLETQVIEEVRARIERFPFINPDARKVFMEHIMHRLREYADWCEGQYSEHRQELIDRARENEQRPDAAEGLEDSV